MAQRLAFIHAITSLHPGTGQGVGGIDLPVHRERATNLPLLAGSSIKGCLRDGVDWGDKKTMLFGSEPRAETHTKGALHISDAQLLLLPVRCLGATFVWATCPFILRRLERAGAAVGEKTPAIPSVAADSAQLASSDATVAFAKERRLVLEDMDFAASINEDAQKWCRWIGARLFGGEAKGWQAEMEKRFAILDDKSFDYFSEFGTQVTAHIKINEDTGTVEDGALWYEETLPPETVLFSVIQADPPRREPMKPEAILDLLPETSAVQFGGNATTGEGVARFVPCKPGVRA